MSKIININDSPFQKLSARLVAQELSTEALGNRVLEIIQGLNTITAVLNRILADEGGLQETLTAMRFEADVAAAKAEAASKIETPKAEPVAEAPKAPEPTKVA